MGRPGKLTGPVLERIATAVRAGCSREVAARSASVSESTLYAWLARGREQSGGIHRELVDALERAEADAELHAVASWRRAMAGDWRACQAYLERKHPDRWAKRAPGPAGALGGATAGAGAAGDELAGLTPGPEVELSRLSDRQLDQLERLRRAARGL